MGYGRWGWRARSILIHAGEGGGVGVPDSCSLIGTWDDSTGQWFVGSSQFLVRSSLLSVFSFQFFAVVAAGVEVSVGRVSDVSVSGIAKAAVSGRSGAGSVIDTFNSLGAGSEFDGESSGVSDADCEDSSVAFADGSGGGGGGAIRRSTR